MARQGSAEPRQRDRATAEGFDQDQDASLAQDPRSRSVRENISALLQKMNAGDKGAEDALLTGLYRELRRLAAGYLRGDRRDHTLQPTALVNEAYVKMLGLQKVSWQNRAHFLGVAARVMRQILIDYARARMTAKRGGGVDFLQLDEALVFNKRAAQRASGSR
jgi:RNA polymerase sigma factor (TIGR02999 family)